MPDATQDWFICTSPHGGARLTIFAFPQAGGGCSAFAPQGRQLPDWLELATLNLPGRQARFDEPPCTELASLIPPLVEHCAQHDKPFIFFGYCAGALLAYSVACGLQDSHRPTPERLVVGSFLPPHHTAAAASLSDLDSDAFWATLVDGNAVPPDIAAHDELRALAEPVIRADMALVTGYRHAARAPLTIPITLLAGDRDEWLDGAEIQNWADYTAAGFDIHRVPAGHWFMEENPAASVELLAAIAAQEQR